jgi:hypothetical protein
MKKSFVIAAVLLALAGCSEKDLRQAYELVDAGAAQAPLTRSEVVAGLKDSLARGISKGALQAAAENGYYGDPRLRIPFPPEFEKVEKTLREAGLGSQVDRFVRQLNRGAEKAAARARPIFIKAITSMTIGDAFEILNGPADAATQYLRRTTGEQLRAEFRPIVRDKLEETSATRYYGDIVNRYNKLPFVNKVDPDLEVYATDRAIDGLFLLIADEEANIRANPRARTTELLRRVFGSRG